MRIVAGIIIYIVVVSLLLRFGKFLKDCDDQSKGE